MGAPSPCLAASPFPNSCSNGLLLGSRWLSGCAGGSGPGFRLSVPALLPPQAPLPVLPHPSCSAPPIQLCHGAACGSDGAAARSWDRTWGGTELHGGCAPLPQGWSWCLLQLRPRGQKWLPPIKCFHAMQERLCETSKVLCIPPHVSLTKSWGGQIACGLQGFFPSLGKDPWKARGQQQVWGVCTAAPVPPGKIMPDEGEFC